MFIPSQQTDVVPTLKQPRISLLKQRQDFNMISIKVRISTSFQPHINQRQDINLETKLECQPDFNQGQNFNLLLQKMK